MKLSDIDLNLFVVFDAIYTEGNLTRAGDIIGITQPAVSNSLSRLRNMFDDPLFVRTADGMVPTPVAQNIIGSVRQALGLMRASVQESESFDPKSSDKHPSIGDELDIDSYLKLRHIQISSRRGGLGQVDLALGKMGKRRQIALRTQHYLAVSELVTRTDLALTVPQIFADNLVSQLPVRYLQLPFSVPNLESHLYWHESTDQDRANRWLRGVIRELYEKPPWK